MTDTDPDKKMRMEIDEFYKDDDSPPIVGYIVAYTVLFWILAIVAGLKYWGWL